MTDTLRQYLNKTKIICDPAKYYTKGTINTKDEAQEKSYKSLNNKKIFE